MSVALNTGGLSMAEELSNQFKQQTDVVKSVDAWTSAITIVYRSSENEEEYQFALKLLQESYAHIDWQANPYFFNKIKAVLKNHISFCTVPYLHRTK